MDYPNFFESQKEAYIRLNGTVVLLAGEPVEVVALSEHLKDGVVYAYVRPIGLTHEEMVNRPNPTLGHNAHLPTVGITLDAWMQTNPSGQLRRVPLGSPEFNKFRPYELGMYWDPPHVYYVERQPNRKTEQGLISTMLVTKKLALEEDKSITASVNMYGPEMYRCIKGEHPTPQRCIEALTCNKYANKAAAFHRHFALIRGPVDTLFLSYKTNTIGVLPHGDLSQVRLSRDFSYTREVVEELHLFNDIRI